MKYEDYMDDYDSYQRLIPVVKCTTCKCEKHCGTDCAECDYCPDCDCKLCAETKD